MALYETTVDIRLPVGFTVYFQSLGGAPGRWAASVNSDTATHY